MKNWKSLLIAPQQLLSEVISQIDKGAQRILLVVNENQQLLGTITDGDIRRALIKRMDMSGMAQDVMRANPKTGLCYWSREKFLHVMKNNNLLQLPIIDENNVVVGLETLYDVIRKAQYDNYVLLFAGGFGKRLHPLTQDCPKPLLKVGCKPILEVILEKIIDAGFSKFFISTHFKSEMISDVVKQIRTTQLSNHVQPL